MNGTWGRIHFYGHPAEIYMPAGIECPGMTVLFLHSVGLETLRDRPAFTAVFDELKLCCVSPIVQQSWWTDKICTQFDDKLTPERYVLDCVLPTMGALGGSATPRIGLLGISTGGQGALRLAFKHPHAFPVVAAISSAIDYHELYGQGTPLDAMYDSKEQCRQDTAPMHINPGDYPPHVFFCIDPSDWSWYRGNDRLHEKLAALGVAHEYDLKTQAGGHSWDYFDHMADRAIRFVHQGMAAEGRRLL